MNDEQNKNSQSTPDISNDPLLQPVQVPVLQPIPPAVVPKKHRALKAYLIIASILMLVGFGSPFLMWLIFVTPAIGMTGSEFLALFVLIIASYAWIAAGIIAVVTAIVIIVALIRKSVRGKFLITLVVIASLLSALGLIAGVNVVRSNLATKERAAERTNQLEEKIAEYERQDEVARSTATVEEATTLLQDCKVFGFYYTDQGPGGTEDAESTETGILLYYISSSDKYRMHIADRMIDTMVPVARSVQASCGGPQFWHDGSYEHQNPDGSWH